MFISDNFSQTSALNALVGGIGIGVVCAIYTAKNGVTMPSSTFDKEVHLGMALATVGFALNGIPGSTLEPEFSDFPFVRTVVAGLIVGVGSKLGNGCTSGNGVQGLGTLSPASFVFVMLFMMAGAVTTLLLDSAALVNAIPVTHFHWECASIATALIALQFWIPNKSFANIAGGAAFVFSLIVSSMVKPSKVIQFLDFTNDTNGWDPSLAFVMGGACCVTLVSFRSLMSDSNEKKSDFRQRRRSSLTSFAARPIDFPLIAGGILFGVGWGMTGICPGPGFINSVYFATLGAPQALAWGLALFAGHNACNMMLSDEYKERSKDW